MAAFGRLGSESSWSSDMIRITNVDPRSYSSGCRRANSGKTRIKNEVKNDLKDLEARLSSLSNRNRVRVGWIMK